MFKILINHKNIRFSARLSFSQPKNASVSPFGLFTDRNGRYSYPFIYFIFLSPRRVPPFLAWGDFHARSRFARSTIPEEKWGTTRSLSTSKIPYFFIYLKPEEVPLSGGASTCSHYREYTPAPHYYLNFFKNCFIILPHCYLTTSTPVLKIIIEPRVASSICKSLLVKRYVSNGTAGIKNNM